MTLDFQRFGQPVEPELFVWCLNTYSAAAQLKMPVENPAAKPVLEYEDKLYSFSDNPTNRGMLAVMKELRERKIPEEQRMSFAVRIMHFGEILQSKKLGKFMKPGEEPEELMVSEALMRACATAKILTSKKQIKFDIADVERIAQRLTEEDQKKEKLKVDAS